MYISINLNICNLYIYNIQCYHLFEIYCDSTEVSNPHKTPISPFGELFDHMNSYKSLLYVSLVANIIVFIILFCLFFYTIMVKNILFYYFNLILKLNLLLMNFLYKYIINLFLYYL